MTTAGVKRQLPTRESITERRGVGRVAAVLLLGGDEHVLGAELRRAMRGREGRMGAPSSRLRYAGA